MAKAPSAPAVLAVQEFLYLKPDAEAPEPRAFITADVPTINLTGLDVTELPDEARAKLAEEYTAYQTAFTAHKKDFPSFATWLMTENPEHGLPPLKWRSFALNRIIPAQTV